MSNDTLPSWHQISVEESLKQLNVSPEQGLTIGEVDRRREAHGRNILTKDTGKSPFQLFIGQFKDPMIYILIAAFLLMIFMSEWLEAAVVFVIVLANAVIGFAQESKALKAMDALAKSMEIEATVVRDGATERIPADQLVPGDIVMLQSGDKVPADLRLLKIRELQVDESALTGESVPVRKQTAPLAAVAWLYIITATFIIILFVELMKWYDRRKVIGVGP
jgi:cation-transporting ATPase F